MAAWGQAPATLPAGDAPPGTTAPAGEIPRYTFRTDHDPDGIGKFYMGREISRVMGHEGADWLERPEREQQERAARMLAALKLRPGNVVADIGAGSGYHTFRLARIVGPRGRVMAVDIQEEMLDIIRERMAGLGWRNIEPVLGEVDNPKLEPESIDLALMVDVYHEFEWPYEMMRHIVAALKPGGRVAFVEFKAEDPRIPIKPLHKMSETQVIREMRPFELKHHQTVKTLPWQHLIIFEKPAASTQAADEADEIERARDGEYQRGS